ncbi:GNAT family N-acetyltransferase [Kitasatospora sp. NPDC058162]|uniref:GNAT family N-acetyltransferase n=1 Tax=Kitasatospora sp. NPDC058162 TaxID=3346362 RepID=UPI0036DF596D
MNTTVTVHRDLADLPHPGTAHWDTLFGPRGFYAASPWLGHAQATAATAPYYFTVTDGAEWIGALPAYPLEQDTPYVFCSPGRVVDTLHRQATGEPAPWAAELMPALACGGRNPSHTKAGVAPGLDPRRRREVLAAMVAEAERQAWAAGLQSVSFLYVDEDDDLLRGVLADAQYISLPGQTAYSLTVPEDGSFDSYLARFDQRHRVKLKRELRALAEAGVTYRTRPLTEELIDQIAPLEMALYARHGTTANPTAFRAVFDSIAANTGHTARVTTAHLDETLIGFALTFTHGGELYARQAGFDYDAKGRLPVYFGLVYYELLRLALAEGLTHIHYSTGSDRVKLSRGCTPRPQHTYLKPRHPTLTAHLTHLAHL